MDLEELDAVSLEKLLLLVRQLTGISMGTSKKTMIQGRLRPRLRQLGLSSYDQYIQYITSHKSESQDFINLMTTNETSFFRTQRVWDYFTKDFLPTWSVANPQKTLKIWSGASSSGEEIYTIGICCEDHRQKNKNFNYQILGTDISLEMIALAEKGLYAGRSIENFKTSYRPLFDKYMMATETTFGVGPEIRSRIRFAHHNLFRSPSMRNHYDIVFLRNVLIYFEPQDQEIVLANVSQSLLPTGFLIVGESESLSSLKTPFQHKLPLVYTKKEGAVG